MSFHNINREFSLYSKFLSRTNGSTSSFNQQFCLECNLEWIKFRFVIAAEPELAYESQRNPICDDF